jgi:multiple sugar transport system substrate-binding protein
LDGDEFTAPAERFSRRRLLRQGVSAGLTLSLLPTIATGCRSSAHRRATRPLTGLFQAWVLQLYPQLAALGSPRPQISAITREILAHEARRGESAVDFYVGVTPFDDMDRLRRANVLAPWEGPMRTAVAEALPAQVRRESSVAGELYSWPFLLDVTVLGWNADLVERAGLDPTTAPRTWDELIDNARRVVTTGAAPYGVTFDPKPWRSLVPITYSFSTDVYDDRGHFDYRSDAAASALAVMRPLRELANPDLFDTPHSDEEAFASGLSAYYLKYQNAHIRMAASWPDPGRLVLARLPRPPGGAGKTVFWTTGIGLLRFGENRRAAAAYAESLTFDPAADAFWETAIGGGRAAGGQLPAFDRLWRRWKREPPSWLPAWATAVYAQLDNAAPIPPSLKGAGQFNSSVVAKLAGYLDGGERNPRVALEGAAKAAAQP